MRITGGIYRGRTLQAPQGRATRPTGDKVREAVFTMLDARDALNGALGADLCCGSGALGLEALSRGAAHVTFVDNNTQALQSVRANCRTLNVAPDHYTIRRTALPQLPVFETPLTLVFLDPPYDSGMIGPTLNALTGQSVLAEGALIVCETSARHGAIVDRPDSLTIEREKHYGDTAITLLACHRLSGT